MATTTYGSPYVSGTDLVANWPAASLTVAQSIDSAGYYIGRGNNTQTGSMTTVLTDAGKTITMSNASANTVTIPANSSVAYVIGTRINILNLGAGACTPTAAAGVTIAGTITALATNQAASVIKTATNTWSYVPFSSGTAAAVISSSTGSPTITTDGTATVYKFTGDGTLVVGTAGAVRLLAVGAGGGAGQGTGGAGGGGGGGQLLDITVTLPATTYTIKVPAGGAGGPAGNNPGTSGGPSVMRNVLQSLGGGGGGLASGAGRDGVSWYTGGGAGGYNPTAENGGAALTTIDGIYAGGNASGSAPNYGGGGGAGNSGAGANGSGGAGGAGGTGNTSDILVTGVNVTFGTGGAGGAGGAGASGASNTGIGGTAGTTTNNGGSGVVIVRVG